MKLSVGIVGLPNVGKSLLFKLLTKQEVVIANYPFATVDPNVGVVPVPDKRLDKVAELINPEKVIPAVVEFFDIAGLVKGAHKGEGLGNQFLAKIREVQVIAHVVRCFESEEAAHHEGSVDPIRDIDIIHTELVLKDLETVEKKLEDLRRNVKSAGEKSKIKSLEAVEKVYGALADGKLASTLPDGVLEDSAVRELFLLTAKQQIYVLNGKKDNISEELLQKIEGSEYIASDLIETQNLNEFIQKSYKALGLVSFFTITGEKEAHAWAVEDGTNIRSAVGEIHSDFEEKFIKADVINWEELVLSGSWSEAKHKGKVRLEGKNYVVCDGDVVEVKHG